MPYPSSLLEHLARHKREQLGIKEDGIWVRNRRPYPHLLPQAQKQLNLLPSMRESCLEYMKAGGKKLHRDFHHLNSSQAFALNLFYPLLTDISARDVLAGALGLGRDIVDWEFEAVPYPAEGTNFDAMLTLDGGSRAYIEVKLTESGFGSARANALRREKLEAIYRDRLRGKVRPSALQETTFFKHYQLLRNLSYVDDPVGSKVILVFPGANLHAKRAATQFLEEVVLPEARKSVAVHFAEDLTETLLRLMPPSTAAAECLQLVVRKYALGPGLITAAV